jgi:signal transduction histidine kinase
LLNFYTTLRQFLFTGLFLALAATGICQNRGADSLRNLLLNPKLTDQARVDLLNNLSYELYDVNDSAAFIAARKALALAEKNKYHQGIKYAYTLIGLGHNANGNYQEALQYFVMSDRIDVPDMLHIASYNQVLLGNTYRDLAEYDSAEFYYNMAMSIISQTGNKAYKARVHKNLGQLYLILWRNADALKQLEMAEDLLRGSVPDVYQLADVLSLYGLAYENLLDYDKARIYFGRMCEVANARNDAYHKIICVLNKADLTSRRGDFAAALQYCFDAIEMSKQYQYPPQMVEIYFKTGEVYMELSQYALASKYLFEALKISERLGLRYQTAKIFADLSWINKDQGNFPLALDYINRSQKIREDIGDQHGVSNSQNIRGLIYYQQKRYDQALQEFDKSIAIRKAIGHEKGIAAGLYNSSLVYQDLGQYETTYKLQMQALAIDEKTDDKYNLSIDYNTLAELLVQMNRLDEAERYMLLAHDLAKATQSKMLIRNSLRAFAGFYEKKKDYAKAFRYQKEYQQVNDSIYSTDNSVKMAEMQALYQIEQKEQQIKLLNQERQIQEDQIKLQKSRISQQYLFIVLVSVALLLVTIVAYLSYRYGKQIRKAHREILEQKEEIRMQSEELIEANRTIAKINKGLEQKIDDRTSALTQAYKELDIFFYRSSHDFRRPLTTFMGLAEVAKVTVKDNNALELFDKVNETAHNLDKMLIKLQSISDVGAQQLIYKEVFLKDLYDSICDSFRAELDQRNIKTTYESHLTKPFISYPAMVKIIIENLVENSIHFWSKQNPFIALKISCVDDFVEMELRDNGEGIDPQYHNRIFEMYFRGSERSKGNGLGLYIVKKAVEKLHGTIRFTSGVGKGSVFVVTLPLETEHPIV